MGKTTQMTTPFNLSALRPNSKPPSASKSQGLARLGQGCWFPRWMINGEKAVYDDGSIYEEYALLLPPPSAVCLDAQTARREITAVMSASPATLGDYPEYENTESATVRFGQSYLLPDQRPPFLELVPGGFGSDLGLPLLTMRAEKAQGSATSLGAWSASFYVYNPLSRTWYLISREGLDQDSPYLRPFSSQDQAEGHGRVRLQELRQQALDLQQEINRSQRHLISKEEFFAATGIEKLGPA